MPTKKSAVRKHSAKRTRSTRGAGFAHYVKFDYAPFAKGVCKLPQKCSVDDIGYDSQGSTNDQRAEYAFRAIAAYAKATNNELATEGLETVALDFLGDFAHLCDRTGIDLQDLLRRAANHYNPKTQYKGVQFTRSSSGTLTHEPRIALVVKKALQGDSNDAEHDALLEIATLLDVTVVDPEDLPDFSESSLLAVIRSEYTLQPDWFFNSGLVAAELRSKGWAAFDVRLANGAVELIELRVEGGKIVVT